MTIQLTETAHENNVTLRVRLILHQLDKHVNMFRLYDVLYSATRTIANTLCSAYAQLGTRANIEYVFHIGPLEEEYLEEYEALRALPYYVRGTTQHFIANYIELIRVTVLSGPAIRLCNLDAAKTLHRIAQKIRSYYHVRVNTTTAMLDIVTRGAGYAFAILLGYSDINRLVSTIENWLYTSGLTRAFGKTMDVLADIHNKIIEYAK